VNLQRAAREALEKFGGIPTEEAKLLTLPGVGPYTAAAVACFAGDKRTVALDTNIARVVARTLLGEATARVPHKQKLKEAAKAWLPKRGTRAHQLAAMDLGATVCKASSPACEICPLKSDCTWLAAGQPEADPTPNGKVTAAPFKSTARFARGQIVAILAKDSPLPASSIAAQLPEEHQENCGRYLEALAGDGIVTFRKEHWGLAEDL
tara:strand:- start:267 stop:890 length:624 start_codon:yes stop_codon:yes gene_type:complete